jgi:four helix bundle protein
VTWLLLVLGKERIYIIFIVLFFMRDYGKLKVWQRAVDLIVVIKDVTMRFPEYEKYEIGRQMRRAVSSISFNIAEGSGRRTNKDYIQFLHIAIGSANELKTQIISVDKLGYLREGEAERIVDELNEIGKMISGVIRFLRKN